MKYGLATLKIFKIQRKTKKIEKQLAIRIICRVVDLEEMTMGVHKI